MKHTCIKGLKELASRESIDRVLPVERVADTTPAVVRGRTLTETNYAEKVPFQIKNDLTASILSFRNRPQGCWTTVRPRMVTTRYHFCVTPKDARLNGSTFK